MRIKNGTTRHVILTRHHAIKIARLTPFHVVLASARYLKRGFKSQSGKSWRLDNRTEHPFEYLLLKLRHHVALGLKANRAEVKYWRETKDESCVPVVSSWLFGLIIIQPRAEEVTKERIQRSRLAHLINGQDRELVSPEQYGLYGGRVRIVDFAHLGDAAVLI